MIGYSNKQAPFKGIRIKSLTDGSIFKKKEGLQIQQIGLLKEKGWRVSQLGPSKKKKDYRSNKQDFLKEEDEESYRWLLLKKRRMTDPTNRIFKGIRMKSITDRPF